MMNPKNVYWGSLTLSDNKIQMLWSCPRCKVRFIANGSFVDDKIHIENVVSNKTSDQGLVWEKNFDSIRCDCKD